MEDPAPSEQESVQAQAEASAVRWMGRICPAVVLAGLGIGMALVIHHSAAEQAHGAEPAHPTAYYVGLVLFGLSPLVGFLGYALAGRGKQTPKRVVLALAVAAAVYAVTMYAGAVLFSYGSPVQSPPAG
jgi:hypothetical protein